MLQCSLEFKQLSAVSCRDANIKLLRWPVKEQANTSNQKKPKKLSGEIIKTMNLSKTECITTKQEQFTLDSGKEDFAMETEQWYGLTAHDTKESGNLMLLAARENFTTQMETSMMASGSTIRLTVKEFIQT